MRIVSRDGRPDIDGPSNGRGAWLCRSDDGDFVVDGACLAAAIDRRAFARAWRREVSADEVATIRHALLREGDAKERGAPDAH